MDDAQLGEFAYDYVELRREFADVILGEEESGTGSGKGSVSGGEGVKEVPIEKV